jgi:BASS family bile acid:Na+ symporter
VDTQRLVSLVNVTALVVIMVSMGLRVTFAQVAASARSQGRVLLAVAANYALVPAVTVGLLALIQPSAAVAVGFLILAVCPGAPFAPPATEIARGDVPNAIGLMVLLAGLSAVVSPTLLGLLLPWIAPDSPATLDYLSVVRTLLLGQMLPLTAGLVVRHMAPAWAARLSRPVGVLANILLAGLVVLILATQYQTLAEVRAGGWAGMAVLFLSSLAIGWICGTGATAVRKATALTTSARNAAVGLVIATGNFPGGPVVTAVVAYGVVSMLGTLGCAAILGRLAAANPAVVVTPRS